MSRRKVIEVEPLDHPTGFIREGKELTINEFIDWVSEDGLPDFVRPFKLNADQDDVWQFVTQKVWEMCSTGGRCYWQPLSETLQQMHATQLERAKEKPPGIEPVVL